MLLLSLNLQGKKKIEYNRYIIVDLFYLGLMIIGGGTWLQACDFVDQECFDFKNCCPHVWMAIQTNNIFACFRIANRLSRLKKAAVEKKTRTHSLCERWSVSMRAKNEHEMKDEIIWVCFYELKKKEEVNETREFKRQAKNTLIFCYVDKFNASFIFYALTWWKNTTNQLINKQQIKW